MATTTPTAEDDLAYLRALVAQGRRAPLTGGSIFVATGAIYGLQSLIYWAELRGLIAIPQSVHHVLGLGPTVLFVALLTWVLWRDRGQGPTGLAARAMTAAFTAIGITNLVMAAIFAPAALRAGSMDVWLFFPAVVFVLQGTAWLVASMIRRRVWMAAVSGGWFVSGVALGLAIGDLANYVLIVALAMGLFMVLPGLKLVRDARAAT
ncbi:hypothetical protein sos41_05060 [Alphaproteobacteria bacterium SO-S41]|nr:hypothetical protein sos41_05060 [Alphaproteobacteria bacterium SO-S41]